MVGVSVLPLAFTLITIVFSIDLMELIGVVPTQYYYMLSSFFLYIPPSLDSLVTMCLVREYRR